MASPSTGTSKFFRASSAEPPPPPPFPPWIDPRNLLPDSLPARPCSGPDWDSIAELHALFPNVSYLATEATVAVGVRGTPWYVPSTTQDYWSHGEFYGTYILNDLNSWSTGFIDWNLMLDQNGAPDHGDPTGELCEGLIPCGSNAMIIADVSLSPPKVYKQAFYWYMAHVSRFVPPGSVRIECNLTAGGGGGGDATNVTAAAFTTPGGGTVFVVMNARDDARSLVLSDVRFGSIEATIAAHSIETWLW